MSRIRFLCQEAPFPYSDQDEIWTPVYSSHVFTGAVIRTKNRTVVRQLFPENPKTIKSSGSSPPEFPVSILGTYTHGNIILSNRTHSGLHDWKPKIGHTIWADDWSGDHGFHFKLIKIVSGGLGSSLVTLPIVATEHRIIIWHGSNLSHDIILGHGIILCRRTNLCHGTRILFILLRMIRFNKFILLRMIRFKNIPTLVISQVVCRR